MAAFLVGPSGQTSYYASLLNFIRRRGCSTCLLVFLLAVPETCEHLIMRLYFTHHDVELFDPNSRGVICFVRRTLFGNLSMINRWP